jgi:uncharacterized heparinase superfamily protein
MLIWMNHMTQGDGRVSCFNDSATNIASSPADIAEYAKRLGFRETESPFVKSVRYDLLSDSGYVSVTRGNLKMVLDVAKLGPDYLLAHAHADSLTFELSLATQRLIVNSGTSCYGSSDRRHFERSTRAHNSVEIDGCSSSEVWSSFRVARRAYPFGLKITSSGSVLAVECSHNGYKRLSGSPIHKRNWIIDQNKVIIKDHITGVFASAVSRFIFHPDIMISQIDEVTFILTGPNEIQLTLSVNSGVPDIEAWKSTDKFGCLTDTYCLEISLINGKSLVELL